LTDYETIQLAIKPPFARLTLNRPQVRNAMNFQMVDELIHAFEDLCHHFDIRAVVLSGAGGNFSVGGDLSDVAKSAQMSAEERDATAARFDTILRAVNTSPHVIIAKLEGAVLGGGFGLACVSDIAIAAQNASFGLPEVRLGLAPSLISPFVIARIGITCARMLMLTGERFDGSKALEYGIVHEVRSPEGLDERINALLDTLRQCSPNAIREIKGLIHEVSTRSLDETVLYRAQLLNKLRYSDEGQEGITAFMEKRPSKWTQTS
jgi:isohexenylglutaconyl-CoA hydratase